MFKRKEHQRFSLRKYSVGLASVFLGMGISFSVVASNEVKAAETEAKSELTAKANDSQKVEVPEAVAK